MFLIIGAKNFFGFVMREKEKTTLRKIEHHSRESFYLIVRGAEVGVFAGLVCVAYRKLLELSEGWLFQIIDYVKGSPLKTALWLLALGLIGVIVHYIVKAAPESAGSGIPQVTGEVKGYLTSPWLRTLCAKLLGGSLSVFAGLSLGREGPSVQLAGMAAKGVAKITKADKTTTLRMISCGAGAGLSAAFNAPLAGIMYVLEEIHRTFDKSILCMGIVAAVVADYISKFFFGQNTIFNYQTENVPLRHYWLLIIMGLLLGLLGAFYNWFMLKTQDLYKRISKIPEPIKLAIVFVVSGVVGLWLPQVLCGGHRMAELLITEHPSIRVLLALCVAKFLFGAFSFGSGAPGGTLYPLSILGTYIGAIYGDFVIGAFDLNPDLWQEFVVLGMAGFFASIVRAPITGVIVVFEISGNMNNILPLATVALISYATANTLGSVPFYDASLERILKAKGMPTGEDGKVGERVLQTYVVPLGSKIVGKTLAEVDWGKHCLVVAIERGELSVTPKGDTEIMAGDTLLIMVSQRRFSQDRNRLDNIINGN